MAKRRRRKKNTSWVDHFDWNVNPETVREVIAVGLVAIGLISLLAMFGAAGALGSRLNSTFTNLLGNIHFLVPFFLLAAGGVVWNPKALTLRWTTLGGVVLLFITLPGVISPFGGSVGDAVSGFVSGLVGSLAGLVVLAALVIMSVLLIFNTSFKSLFSGVSMPALNLKMPEIAKSNEGDSRVSVFQAVREKLKSNAPQINTRPQVQVSAQSSTLNHKSSNAGDWQFPPLDLMNLPKGKATAGNVVKNVETIQKTLKDFNISVTMGDVNIGPTVTQYTLKPAEGVRLNQITSRSNDLALALAAPSIRIEAPIPGKSAVGIEVPNKVAAMVTLREVLETDEFKKVNSSLAIALGRNAAGEPKAADLKKMPHLLIAGSTGSGKSIAINSLITGLICQNTPEELRMILVDPKRVEFTPFNDIPHLLTPVITEPDKTINTLKWSLVEMERRYKMLQDAGSRDIVSFNTKNPDNTLPYIVIVIDELADLMAQSAKEVEGAIVRLAQMARAVGMHLVVATQRPSVDVITGLIKANITTRMAFTVASQIDSRTIIDSAGAEKLLGKGDMLFISPEYSSKPRRIQGCLLTEKEIEDVTGFLKKNSPPRYNEEVANYSPKGLTGGVGGDGEVDDDLFDEARQTVVQAGKASASLLQRRLRVGYARAARLLDLLEDQGIIGPAAGSKPRDVLVGLESEFPTMPSGGDDSSQSPPGFTQ